MAERLLSDWVAAEVQLAPEIVPLLRRRYAILRALAVAAPVGRRALAERLSVPERPLRADLEVLRQQGILSVSAAGMSLTEGGKRAYLGLQPLVEQLLGLDVLAQQVRISFGLPMVQVVSGDADLDPFVIEEMGQSAAGLLVSWLRDPQAVLVVTGGTTVAAVGRALTARGERFPHLRVLPGRGGLGERVELQASTIAAQIATAAGASYRMLHVPDPISPQLYEELQRDPLIADTLAQITTGTLLLHGIGDARTMAERRGLSAEQVRSLLASGAQGEAFGFYLDANGRIVRETPALGVRLEQLPRFQHILAVAGGSAKVAPVLAVLRFYHRMQLAPTLVTDEACARGLIHIAKEEQPWQ
ncbi:MAG: hypothetical protein IMW91_07180 [Firmicutes bacterium]|nr:hypothetical protein [Bacillota bacterium]